MPSITLNSLSDLFATVYHFSVGIAGLAYLGLGLGFLSAAILGARLSDQIYHRVRPFFLLRSLTYPIPKLAARNGGQGKPEMRVPALIFGSFFAPVGLL